jgi:hypothetical protein
MRIWTIHPKYLDAKGLVTLWRETLLAREVLEGKTKGYKNHPQLNRFRQSGRPLDAINQYLSEIYSESTKRGYKFDRQKINRSFKQCQLTVTTGQVDFEKTHLLNKLKVRDFNKYKELCPISSFEIHPLFTLINGGIEKWEILPVVGKNTGQ